MHLPDGLLNDGLAGGLIGAGAGAAAYAWTKARHGLMRKVRALRPAYAMNDGSTAGIGSHRRQFTEKGFRFFSLIGLIFAAQMIDFPMGGGHVGHLIGAALITIPLGLAAGIAGMSAVVVIQATVLGDGGVMALGANVLNMAVIAPVVAWYSFRMLETRLHRRTAIALAAWSSVVCMAIAGSAELMLSGHSAGTSGVIQVHLFIGIGEAAITLLFMRLLRLNRPTEDGS